MSDSTSYARNERVSQGVAPGDAAIERDEDGAPAFRRTATRADILEAANASCTHLSRAQTREVLEAVLDEVTTALIRGESVKLRSFGLFSVRQKRERIGRNPRTGIEAKITPRRVLTFKPSPVLVDRVNGRDAAEEDEARSDR